MARRRREFKLRFTAEAQSALNDPAVGPYHGLSENSAEMREKSVALHTHCMAALHALQAGVSGPTEVLPSPQAHVLRPLMGSGPM